MGRRDCLAKKNFFFTSSGAQRWAEREMGNTKKNTATLIHMYIYMGERIAGKQDRFSLIIEDPLRAPKIPPKYTFFLHFGP